MVAERFVSWRENHLAERPGRGSLIVSRIQQASNLPFGVMHASAIVHSNRLPNAGRCALYTVYSEGERPEKSHQSGRHAI